MRFFDQFSKNTARPDEDNFSMFLIVVAGAAMLLTCFLIYALVYPALFEDGEPEYEIVPYSTATSQPVQPVVQPTTIMISPPAPTATTLPTQTPVERITAQTVSRLNQVRALAGHSNAISSVAYSSNGRYLASGDLAGLVKLWDASSYVEIYTFQSGSNRVDAVAFAPDGSRLAAAGQDTLVRQWDLTTGSELPPLAGPTGSINSLAYSSSGALLAAASDDGFVYLWNLATGALASKLQGHTSYATSVDFNTNGTVIAAGGEDDTVRLWSLPGGSIYGTLTGHTSTVTDVTFSPDGNTLASTSADRTVRLWDVLSASQIALLAGHSENVNSVTFTPDGLLIASAAGGISDNTVRLWDRLTGAQVGALYPAGPANSVAFSPNGLTLALGGANYLTIWAVTNTPQQPTGPVVSQPIFTPAPMLQGQAVLPPAGEPCYLTVRLNDVNVRSGPGVNYLYMSTVNSGTTVQAMGWARGIDGDGFTWWRTSDGGWIRGDVFTDVANPRPPDACMTLPEITAIPPTPNATLFAPAQPTAPIFTPAATCILTVRAEQVNIRSGVGQTAPAVGQLLRGQTVEAVGWATGPEFYTWWRTASGGWIRGDAFLDGVSSIPQACLTLPPAQ